MYGEMYERRCTDIETGRVKKTKKRILELNQLLRDSIENARAVTTALNKYEDKFEYL